MENFKIQRKTLRFDGNVWILRSFGEFWGVLGSFFGVFGRPARRGTLEHKNSQNRPRRLRYASQTLNKICETYGSYDPSEAVLAECQDCLELARIPESDGLAIHHHQFEGERQRKTPCGILEDLGRTLGGFWEDFGRVKGRCQKT